MSTVDHHQGTGCGLDEVLITAELARRPSRPPTLEAEDRALAVLARQMSADPGGILQKLAELVLDLCRAQSAGVSLLEPGGENGVFRWPAVAGAIAPHLLGTMPRDASPCGMVLHHDAVLLFQAVERRFPALQEVELRFAEALLAPWHVGGAPAGTVWAIQHTPERRFDAEDARLLASLARFAAAAHRIGAGLEVGQPSWVRAALAEIGGLLAATHEQLAATRRLIAASQRAVVKDRLEIEVARLRITRVGELRRAGPA